MFAFLSALAFLFRGITRPVSDLVPGDRFVAPRPVFRPHPGASLPSGVAPGLIPSDAVLCVFEAGTPVRVVDVARVSVAGDRVLFVRSASAHALFERYSAKGSPLAGSSVLAPVALPLAPGQRVALA